MSSDENPGMITRLGSAADAPIPRIMPMSPLVTLYSELKKSGAAMKHVPLDRSKAQNRTPKPKLQGPHTPIETGP